MSRRKKKKELIEEDKEDQEFVTFWDIVSDKDTSINDFNLTESQIKLYENIDKDDYATFWDLSTERDIIFNDSDLTESQITLSESGDNDEIYYEFTEDVIILENQEFNESNHNREEFKLIESLRKAFKNEFHLDKLSNNKLSKFFGNRHLINMVLRNKSEFMEITIEKIEEFANNTISDKKNLGIVINALNKYKRIKSYDIKPEAPNILEIKLIENLREAFSNELGNVLSKNKLSGIFGNRKLLTNVLNQKRRISDATIENIEIITQEKLSEEKGNLKMAIDAINEYREKRGPIYDDNYRQSQSKRMKKQWKDKNFLQKMEKLHKSEEYRQKLREIHGSQELRQKHGEISQERWNNDKYREKMEKIFSSEEFKKQMGKLSKERWNDENFKEKMKRIQNSKEFKEKMSKSQRLSWKDVNKKKKLSKFMKKLWENDEYHEKMTKMMSSLQYRQKRRDIMNKLYKDPEYKSKHYKSILRGNVHPSWNPNRDEVLQPYGPDFYYNMNQQINELYEEQCGMDAWTGKTFTSDDMIVRHHIKYDKSKSEKKDLVLVTKENHGKINHPPHPRREVDKIKILKAKKNFVIGKPPAHWSIKLKRLFKQRKKRQAKLSEF